jgi:hypothetical protein
MQVTKIYVYTLYTSSFNNFFKRTLIRHQNGNSALAVLKCCLIYWQYPYGHLVPASSPFALQEWGDLIYMFRGFYSARTI